MISNVTKIVTFRRAEVNTLIYINYDNKWITAHTNGLRKWPYECRTDERVGKRGGKHRGALSIIYNLERNTWSLTVVERLGMETGKRVTLVSQRMHFLWKMYWMLFYPRRRDEMLTLWSAPPPPQKIIIHAYVSGWDVHFLCPGSNATWKTSDPVSESAAVPHVNAQNEFRWV